MKGLLTNLLVLSSFVGCTTLSSASLIHEKQGVYTIGYHTGSSGQNLYEANFEAKAEDLCPLGYQILEKSFTPKILESFKDLPSSQFYWVLKCS